MLQLTFHFSLFTFYFSLFTFHFLLFTFHFSLFTAFHFINAFRACFSASSMEASGAMRISDRVFFTTASL